MGHLVASPRRLWGSKRVVPATRTCLIQSGASASTSLGHPPRSIVPMEGGVGCKVGASNIKRNLSLSESDRLRFLLNI